MQGLLRDDKGKPTGSPANVAHALRYAPDWAGVLGFDEFAVMVVPRERPPFLADDEPLADRWKDDYDFRTTEWMHRVGIKAGVDIIGKAVQAVGREHPFHPVRKWLDGLVWDKKPRLDDWLIRYAKAKTDEQRRAYIRAVSGKWLIAAVARIHEPGCKVDNMLILKSPQGDGKSTAFHILFSPWFTDCLSDMKTKDAMQDTFGVWCIEISEMASWNKSDQDVAKSYLTRRSDHFRPPYGKHDIDQPRQCVFAGTINPEVKGFLKDPTGNRRYWVIETGKIDLNALARDREQLWAEAVVRYRAGEHWWLETEELITAAADEQDRHYQDDAWTQPVLEWLEQPSIKDRNGNTKNSEIPFTVGEVLRGALGIETHNWNAINQGRVARILTKDGYEQYRTNKGRFYHKPTTTPETADAEVVAFPDRRKFK